MRQALAGRLGILLLASLIQGILTPFAHARSIEIADFRSEVWIGTDRSVTVAETLTINFSGSWNGIYRFIPVRYRTPRDPNFELGIRLLGVFDDQGRELRFEDTRDGDYRQFRVWVPGASDATRQLTIRYLLLNALQFFDSHDEFYWNVTGDQWEIPIHHASLTVHLPVGVRGVRTVGFAGPYGSTEQSVSSEVVGSIVRVETSRGLGMHEGFTAAVAWDPGIVERPGQLEKLGSLLVQNWYFIFPLLAFGLMFRRWLSVGRDPRKGPVVPRYEPPAGLTPAEVGTLIDNQPHVRDITASIVSLAVNGHLLIEEKEEDRLLGLWTETAYAFRRLTDPARWRDLRPHEQRLMEELFSRGELESVELKSLRNAFYKHLPAIRDLIFTELVGQGYYRTRPDHVLRLYLILAGAALALMLAGLKLVTGSTVGILIAGITTAAVIAGFGMIMPARTLAGARILDEIRGFEEFLDKVESDRFRRMITSTRMFEAFLPFAIALGVEQNWAKAFESIFSSPPDWYRGSHPQGFQMATFLSSIRRMSQLTDAAISSSPRSAGGSGFSGGGSSGGGFGGGGGGGF